MNDFMKVKRTERGTIVVIRANATSVVSFREGEGEVIPKSQGNESERLCDEALVLHQAGNDDEALKLWHRAADMGSGRGMRNIGVVARSRGDLNSAQQWYRRSAEAGEVEGWMSLGVVLIELEQINEACAAFEHGARLGHGGCAFNLGQIYREMRADPDSAARWYQRAAELGDAPGMNAYAVALRQSGKEAEAHSWYVRSAEAGCELAMINLGQIAMGNRDFANAAKWLEQARDADAPNAAALLVELERLTSEPRPTYQTSRPGRGRTAFSWNELREAATSSSA